MLQIYCISIIRLRSRLPIGSCVTSWQVSTRWTTSVRWPWKTPSMKVLSPNRWFVRLPVSMFISRIASHVVTAVRVSALAISRISPKVLLCRLSTISVTVATCRWNGRWRKSSRPSAGVLPYRVISCFRRHRPDRLKARISSSGSAIGRSRPSTELTRSMTWKP